MTIFSKVKAYQASQPEPYPAENEAELRARVARDLGEMGDLLDPSRSDVFEAAKEIWDRLGIRPENLESFQEQVGPDLFRRFQSITLTLLDHGYWEGREAETHDILRRVVFFVEGGDVYSLSDAATIDRRSIDYCEIKHPNRPVGTRLFEELTDFLRSDVGVSLSETQAERDNHLAHLRSSCWDNNAALTFDAQLSTETVTVREGEDIAIPIQFQSNGYLEGVEVFWHVMRPDFSGTDPKEGQVLFSQDRFIPSHVVEDPKSVRYDEEGHLKDVSPKRIRYRGLTNRRALSFPQYQATLPSLEEAAFAFLAGHDRTTHRQRLFPIQLDFAPRYHPELKVSRTAYVRVENFNEAPQAHIQAPTHVDEGEEVCFQPVTEDPEGDKLFHEWSLNGEGDSLLATRIDEEGNFCVRPPVTGKFEWPIDVKLEVQDVADLGVDPVLKSQTAIASARTFIDPEITLDTGETLKPSSEMVETMTEPERRELGTAASATGAYLYLFMRTPGPLESYAIRPPSDRIVSNLAIEGLGVDGWAKRYWTPFERAPSTPPVAVSHSRLRRWTAAGNYDLSRHALEAARNWFSMSAPLTGSVHVDPPEVRVVLNAEENCQGNQCRYQLRFSDVTDEDEPPFLQEPDRLPVEVSAAQDSTVGRVVITKKVYGTRKENGDASSLVYDVPVSWPEGYVSSAHVQLEAALTNRYGEEATVVYNTGHVGGDRSAFDELRLAIEPMPIPDPWFLMHVGGMDFFPSFYFASELMICPPEEVRRFIQDCTPLDSHISWNRANGSANLQVPLRPSGIHAILASAYRAVGGDITGRVSLTLPDGWHARILLPQTDMTIPPNPNLTVDWDEILKELFNLPEYLWLALFTLKSLFENDPNTKIKFHAEQRRVRPGDRFHIDIELREQNKEGTIRLVGWSNDLSEIAAVTRMHLLPKGGGRKEKYSLEPLSFEKMDRQTYRMTFEVPIDLPRGGYAPELSPSDNMYADYRLTYRQCGTLSCETWEEIMPVIVWDASDRPDLSGLKVEGDPSVRPPAAEIKKIDSSQ